LLAHETVTFTTRVSCNTFESLVCAPITSTNQTKQQLEQDALLPLLSSIHQCNGTCNTFRMIAYLDFNLFPQNSEAPRLRFQRSPMSTLQQHHIQLSFQ
jgi:hypothetical protein